MPDLFSYLDYRRFLEDWFAAKKEKLPTFSHRAFARKAGLTSPSFFLAVTQKKRNLTPATIESFSKAMGLTAEEARFFEALVQFEQADNLEDRTQAWERIRATRRFREARRIEGESAEYLSAWYYPAIRELAACKGFRTEPEWIASTLRPTITASQAKKALELLFSLGLLKQEEGVVVPAEASLVTPHEVAGVLAATYHRGMMERAMESLRMPPVERHLCGVTVAIPAALLPRLKAEIDAFQERLLDLCDAAEGTKDRVVQLNLQLVPLSRSTLEKI